MAKYYCVEDGTILTTEDVRNAYAIACAEDGYCEPFDYFLRSCMTWENGSIQPIETRINTLKRNLRRIMAFAHGAGCVEEYREEIDAITAEITELTDHMKEE